MAGNSGKMPDLFESQNGTAVRKRMLEAISAMTVDLLDLATSPTGGDVDQERGMELLTKLKAVVQGKKRRSSADIPIPADVDSTTIDMLIEQYPRRVAIPAARRAIISALKKVPGDQLLDAVTAYREHCDSLKACGRLTDDKIPHPATWFNGERWNDREDWQKVSAAAKPKDKLDGLREASAGHGSSPPPIDVPFRLIEHDNRIHGEVPF